MSLLHSTRDIGRIGERIAARYLRRHGFRILEKNRHQGRNELDIVAANKELILFVEVKARSFESAEQAELYRPAAAVDAAKRTRTLQAARAYLHQHPDKRCPRIDVIEVYLDRSKRPKAFKINHIEAAFSASGRIR